MSDRREVDRLQFNTIFRVSEKYHLLPLDLSQRVVLDDHDLDRKAILYGGCEIGHQHRKSSVTDEGNALPVRLSDLCCNRVWKSVGHGREIAGKTVHFAAPQRHMAGPPPGPGRTLAPAADCRTQHTPACAPRTSSP